MVPKVMIILGSSSDIKIAEKTIKKLEKLKISYSLKIASAHRTYDIVKELTLEATEAGVEVFIAIAGLSAHLPGVIASYTHRPVIGVPVDAKVNGLDAFYSIVQMPYPIPVSSVGIDRGDNAAILAGQIIATHDTEIKKNIKKLRNEYREKVIKSEKEVLNKLNGEYLNKDFLSEPLENHYFENEPTDINEDAVVSLISGSNSDLHTMKKAAIVLDRLKIPYDMRTLSSVRHCKKFENYVKEMEDVKIFIGVSGLSSQLTGGLVGLTDKIVIGVPCFKQIGVDSLLSMVNMPPGVPVATLGLDNGRNAGILAGEILSLSDENIEKKLLKIKYKKANL